MEKIGEAGCSSGDKLYVPEELVIDILLRLPVESLARCKAVCKNWYILITRNNRTRFLVYHYIPSPTLKTPLLSVRADSHESLSRIIHLDNLPPYIVGPVNGLFLLSHARDRLHHAPLALLNPATRELRRLFLPDANQNPPNMRSDLHTFGFGFDPSTNDFKVVVFWDLFLRKSPWEFGLMIKIAIYSLSNDSWKHLEPYQQMTRNLPSASSGTTYFNGACHWLSGDQHCLLSFDLGSEVMREINGPQDHILSSTDPFLFVYKNEALAIIRCQSACLIDLMVMKEEGRWIKYFTMDLSADSHEYIRVNWPFGICKNNRVFVAEHIIQEKNGEGYKLVLYDPITHELEEVGVPCFFRFANNHDVFSYKENLVSVKGGGGGNKISLSFGDFCSSST